MNFVQVKILGSMHCSVYGTLSTDDLLRCSPEYAKYLVDELKFAEYVVGKVVPEALAEVVPEVPTELVPEVPETEFKKPAKK